MSRKSRVATLSILSNSLLIAMKLVVGAMTGSVSIVSEAIHSLMDLAAALIAYISVKISDKPPDKDHPYGHGKMENVSGVIEAALIVAATFFILKQAIVKLVRHSPVELAGLGFGVMLVSAGVNFLVSRVLYRVAREEDSVAIEADALHLKADVYTSLGVAAGLALMWATGLNILDPLVAILIALFILKEAFDMLWHAFGPLVDQRLPDDEIESIRKIMEGHSTVFIDFHDMRTRKAGDTRHIDLHLTAPQKMSLKEIHDVCNDIEREVEGVVRKSRVLIHAEPCDSNCAACRFSGKAALCGTDPAPSRD